MPEEILNVELSLIAVPLPKEMEEAYWLAMEFLAELMRARIEPLTPGPSPNYGRGGGLEAVAVSLCTESGKLSEIG